MFHLKGLEYEVVEEPLRKWTAWMQEWSARTGERPRIPVLQYWDDNGVEHILPESNDIDFFLDTVDGEPEYTPAKNTASYEEMERWWKWCDEEMKPVIDLFKYGKDLAWDKESNKYYTKVLRGYINELEEHLQDHEYLVEERLTLADIAIIPFVRQIMRTRNGEFDFIDFPRVVAWANTILDADWFNEEVMKKRPLAEVGPAYNG